MSTDPTSKKQSRFHTYADDLEAERAKKKNPPASSSVAQRSNPQTKSTVHIDRGDAIKIIEPRNNKAIKSNERLQEKSPLIKTIAPIKKPTARLKITPPEKLIVHKVDNLPKVTEAKVVNQVSEIPQFKETGKEAKPELLIPEPKEANRKTIPDHVSTEKKLETIIATVTEEDTKGKNLGHGATIITDTKTKRFSFFAELSNSFKRWRQRSVKPKKALPQYTLPPTDDRKGVIQKATSKTGTEFTTNNESLKEQVRQRHEKAKSEQKNTPLKKLPAFEQPADTEPETNWSPFTEPGFNLLKSPASTVASTTETEVTRQETKIIDPVVLPRPKKIWFKKPQPIPVFYEPKPTPVAPQPVALPKRTIENKAKIIAEQKKLSDEERWGVVGNQTDNSRTIGPTIIQPSRTNYAETREAEHKTNERLSSENHDISTARDANEKPPSLDEDRWGLSENKLVRPKKIWFKKPQPIPVFHEPKPTPVAPQPVAPQQPIESKAKVVTIQEVPKVVVENKTENKHETIWVNKSPRSLPEITNVIPTPVAPQPVTLPTQSIEKKAKVVTIHEAPKVVEISDPQKNKPRAVWVNKTHQTEKIRVIQPESIPHQSIILPKQPIENKAKVVTIHETPHVVVEKKEKPPKVEREVKSDSTQELVRALEAEERFIDESQAPIKIPVPKIEIREPIPIETTPVTPSRSIPVTEEIQSATPLMTNEDYSDVDLSKEKETEDITIDQGIKQELFIDDEKVSWLKRSDTNSLSMMVLAVIVAILAIGFTVKIIVQEVSTRIKEDQALEEKMAPLLTGAETKTLVVISGEERALPKLILESKTSAPAGVFEMSVVSALGDEIPPSYIIDLLNFKVLPSLKQSLTTIRFVTIDQSDPVLLIQYVDKNTTLGGMLTWEKTLAEDLKIFYGPSEASPLGFIDQTIAGNDVRVLPGDQSEVLVYGLVGNNTLIIAKNKIDFARTAESILIK